MPKPEYIYSRIWDEEPEPDNPFQARICRCAGYDVYGELLHHASWIEYLFLLFRGERPSSVQARLLETLAIALANAGPRDPAVQAASCAGVGGSTLASRLIAATAVGAGQAGGAHEVGRVMDAWERCGQSFEQWQEFYAAAGEPEPVDVWPEIEHPAGFEPNADQSATPVRQTMECLARIYPEGACAWLAEQRERLEALLDSGLAMTGVAAAALHDLGFDARTGETLFLLLRLPGALAHGLEAEDYGVNKYPFYPEGIILTDDPGPKAV